MVAATRLTREQITELAALLRDSSRTVFCWAMGLTQHRNSVATVKEIANVAFLQGNIGKPGAGLCPVRGHSNVQGDRTMGIWERPKPEFLDALRDEFSFEPPREPGFDTVEAVRALEDGRARVFFAMGGNFVSAVSDTDVTEQAMRRAELTVHVSTKLNRSHVVHGRTALILPGARPQREGPDRRPRAAGHRRGLDVCGARLQGAARAGVRPAALRGRHRLLARPRDPGRRRTPFRGPPSGTTTRRSVGGSRGWCRAARRTTRRSSSRVGSRCRTRRATPVTSRPVNGKAIFSASPLEVLEVPEGHLLLQTLRSHDQFNTTIYGLDDRYRGVKKGRRVVFVHPDDIEHLGWRDGDHVDLVSIWRDGSERAATAFRIVAYDQPRGCAAAYYPETNPLVPLDSKAEGSNTPTSKSVIIRLEKPAGRRTGVDQAGRGPPRPVTSGRRTRSTRADRPSVPG